MHPAAISVMIFGGLLALLGIALFAIRGAQGKNVLKWHGIEIHLTGSSLVIFVVGALLIVFPIWFSDKFPDSPGHSDLERARQPLTPVPTPVTQPELQPALAPDSFTLELTKLVAFKTHCNCDEVGVVIGQKVEERYDMCPGDEHTLSLKENFKHSVGVGLMVLDDCARFDCVWEGGGIVCGRPKKPDAGHWGVDDVITRDAYQRGPQAIRFNAGQGSYELTYVVR